MIIAWYIGLALALTLVAFAASIIGIGGGVLYTPIQLFFGTKIHEAAANSLFLIIILSLSATFIYHRAQRVDWKMALFLEIFTVAGGFAGGYFSEFISETVLTIILIAVVIFSGFTMLVHKGNSLSRSALCDKWYIWKRMCNNEEYFLNLIVACPIAVLAGMIGGMVGVGGGIIKVPMMVLLLHVPVDIAIATSIFMVGITAAGGFAGHVVAGHWNWKLSLLLTPGVFLGARLGAHCMLKINKEKLKRIFGVLMLILAAALSTLVL